jgi:segregation and condensation protein A
MPLEYQVKTHVFEGPLELLLDLIEKRKLFINEISLAKIADDYIARLHEFEKFPVDFVSGFLIVASTLVLIKSKSLLPGLPLTPEETGDITELEDRLRQYRKIRELSVHVREYFGKDMLFPREHVRIKEVRFVPTAEITVPSIFAAADSVLMNLPRNASLTKVVIKKVISIEEMMERLTERITSRLKMNFDEFSGKSKTEKVNIIVSFLAMLELVKQGVIAVTQENHGGDIVMETHVLNTPRYGGTM